MEGYWGIVKSIREMIHSVVARFSTQRPMTSSRVVKKFWSSLNPTFRYYRTFGNARQWSIPRVMSEGEIDTDRR